MLDHEKLNRAILSSAYKYSDTEIDSLFNESNEAALNAILEKDKVRVSEIKKPFEGKFDQGLQAGKKTALTDLEKAVKEKYGFDSDLQGVELVDAIVTSKAKTVDMAEDKVKLTPAYQQLERTSRQQLSDKEKEWETKYNQRETQIQKENKFQDIAKQVRKIRADKGYKIPESAEVAANIEEALFSKLKAFDYKDQDNQTLIISGEGKLVEDGHGRSEDLNNFLNKSLSQFYVMPQNNGGQNAGNGRQETGGQANQGAQGKKFNSEADYRQYMSSTATKEEKMAAYEVNPWGRQPA